jgi:hypothetical protein
MSDARLGDDSDDDSAERTVTRRRLLGTAALGVSRGDRRLSLRRWRYDWATRDSAADCDTNIVVTT